MRTFLPSEFSNFEFLRVLGTAPTHGCDVGECVDVAARVKVNDGESWYRAWSDAAEKAEAAALECISAGDRIGSRWALLRASNYRRSSELMLRQTVPSEDPRRLNAVSQSAALFRRATSLFDSPVESLDIPFGVDGSTLPAYLFLPQRGPEGEESGKIPLLVQVQGFDTIQEEFYHFTVAGALPRGYAVLTFDAPGQGMVLRRKKHRLHLRGDFEVVIKAVLDALWAHAETSSVCKRLDLDRVAISGNSMGAYFALRAAANEPERIKACIASDSFYDLGQVARDAVPGFLRYLNRGLVDRIVSLALRFSPYQIQWELGQGIFAFGATSIFEVVDKMEPFTLQKPDGTSICADVACPTLVTDALDSVFPLAAQRVYDSLTGLADGQTKVMWRPIGVGQGSLQAKVAAFSHLHAKTFSWLDSVFGIKRPSLQNAM